jgi:hypothetical protein
MRHYTLLSGENGEFAFATGMYPIHHGILRFVKFDVLPPFVAWAPAHVSNDARNGHLESYAARLRSLWTSTPLQFPSLRGYDLETFSLKRASGPGTSIGAKQVR